MAGEKYTIRRVHVGGRARVHDPGVGVLERHLVQGGNEAGLIPHLRGGDLSRSERGVRLGVGAKEAGRAPALHALPPAVAAGPPALAALPGAAGLLTRGTLRAYGLKQTQGPIGRYCPPCGVPCRTPVCGPPVPLPPCVKDLSAQDSGTSTT